MTPTRSRVLCSVSRNKVAQSVDNKRRGCRSACWQAVCGLPSGCFVHNGRGTIRGHSGELISHTHAPIHHAHSWHMLTVTACAACACRQCFSSSCRRDTPRSSCWKLPAVMADAVGAYCDAAGSAGALESAAFATSWCCTSCSLLVEAWLRPPSSTAGACSWPGMAVI